MSSFAEIVAEEYQPEVQVIWKLLSTNHAVATFEVRTIAVEVEFEQRETNGAWHVAFRTVGGQPEDRTNMSLAFRIFNGVFQAVREFIETRQPDSVVFASKDEDLASIYEAYLRREKASIEGLGYRLESPSRIDPYTEFVLRRIHPSAWRP